MSKDDNALTEAPKWDDRLLVGHPDIDHEHKSLFAIASRLFIDNQSKLLNVDIGEVLCELADYIQTHFSHEEHLMGQAKYPPCAEHVVEHWNFIQNITILIDHFECRKTGILAELQVFLFEWLITHISEEDRKFGDFWRDMNQSAIDGTKSDTTPQDGSPS